MLNLIRNIKKYSLVSIAVSFVLGVLLIAFPDVCIRYTGLFLGFSLIAIGLFSIISYLVKHKSVLLIYLGAITVVFGIVVCVRYRQIINLIILLCGIGILASGITNLITSIRSVLTFKIVGAVSIVMSVASIILGAIAVMNYSELTNTVIVLIGLALLVFGATELVTYIEVVRLAREAKSRVNEDIPQDVFIDSHSDDIIIDAEAEEN